MKKYIVKPYAFLKQLEPSALVHFNSQMKYMFDLIKTVIDNLYKIDFAVKTDSYTASENLDLIICNKATAMTVTLPLAIGQGRQITVKNVGVGTVTVDGNGADTIDGSTSANLAQHEFYRLIDYAPNKWIKG